jgi:hypothetical protein
MSQLRTECCPPSSIPSSPIFKQSPIKKKVESEERLKIFQRLEKGGGSWTGSWVISREIPPILRLSLLSFPRTHFQTYQLPNSTDISYEACSYGNRVCLSIMKKCVHMYMHSGRVLSRGEKRKGMRSEGLNTKNPSSVSSCTCALSLFPMRVLR